MKKSHHVVLIHGMGRTSASMWPLVGALRAAGFSTQTFDYAVSRKTLSSISGRFVKSLNDGLRAREKKIGYVPEYSIVGHSLGNIITRHAWPEIEQKPSNLIMLAPPNQSPLLARKLKRNPLYRAITRDAGQKLASEKFYRTLAVPDVPTLVIAGQRSPKAQRAIFGDVKNDMIVADHETHLEGSEWMAVDSVHTLIMWKKEVVRAVLDFIGEPVVN